MHTVINYIYYIPEVDEKQCMIFIYSFVCKGVIYISGSRISNYVCVCVHVDGFGGYRVELSNMHVQRNCCKSKSLTRATADLTYTFGWGKEPGYT